MVWSPYRNAISHAPRSAKPTPDDPVPGRDPGRGHGRGLPHSDAKVMQVRQLVETRTPSYERIGKRTGLAPSTISNWCTAGKWTRPLFAPRATDTVPRWRAGIRLRRRTLAGRLYELAGGWVAGSEAQPAAHFAKRRR